MSDLQEKMSDSEVVYYFNFTYPEKPLYPIWLTWMYSSGICQLCDNPEGDVNSYHLNLKFNFSNRLGFYTCDKQECIKKMENYIYNIHKHIFASKSWQNILYKAANNRFISVPRSSGSIDTDWKVVMKTRYDSEYKEKSQYPLNQSFYTAILCSEKCDLICNKLPQELWMYIYDICITLYNEDIHLIFELDKPYILVRKFELDIKDSVEKIVALDTY
jgi:hypothetical protein